MYIYIYIYTYPPTPKGVSKACEVFFTSSSPLYVSPLRPRLPAKETPGGVAKTLQELVRAATECWFRSRHPSNMTSRAPPWPRSWPLGTQDAHERSKTAPRWPQDHSQSPQSRLKKPEDTSENLLRCLTSRWKALKILFWERIPWKSCAASKGVGGLA